MDDNYKRGDLYIQFEIVFPSKISTKNIERINEILPPS